MPKAERYHPSPQNEIRTPARILCQTQPLSGWGNEGRLSAPPKEFPRLLQGEIGIRLLDGFGPLNPDIRRPKLSPKDLTAIGGLLRDDNFRSFVHSYHPIES